MDAIARAVQGVSMNNHVADFLYKMRQECQNQDKPCQFCKYGYEYVDNNGVRQNGCFNADLRRYISYQADKHG